MERYVTDCSVWIMTQLYDIGNIDEQQRRLLKEIHCGVQLGELIGRSNPQVSRTRLGPKHTSYCSTMTLGA